MKNSKIIKFIVRSIEYPNWWHNIGTGMPRTLWKRLLSNTIGSSGYWAFRMNPIYKLYYWANKEKKDWEQRIIVDGNGDMSNKHIYKEALLVNNPNHFVPFHKKIFVWLFDKLKKDHKKK